MVKLKTIAAFTIIEILIVLALAAILVIITFVVINPSKNFADTRNAQRSTDVIQILNAVTDYASEEGNSLSDLGVIPDCNLSRANIGKAKGNINLADVLVDEYIEAIPIDPKSGDEDTTEYTICKTESGRVEISASNAENGKTVSSKK